MTKVWQSDNSDYLLEGLEKKALDADFAGEFPNIWSVASEGQDTFLERPENPFEELRQQIEEHKQEECLIEEQLKDQAQEVMELQDILDTTTANTKTAAYQVKVYGSRKKLTPFASLVEAQAAMNQLIQAAKQIKKSIRVDIIDTATGEEVDSWAYLLEKDFKESKKSIKTAGPSTDYRNLPNTPFTPGPAELNQEPVTPANAPTVPGKGQAPLPQTRQQNTTIPPALDKAMENLVQTYQQLKKGSFQAQDGGTYEVGDRVTIKAGPSKGKEGEVTVTSRDSIRVLLDDGQEVAVPGIMSPSGTAMFPVVDAAGGTQRWQQTLVASAEDDLEDFPEDSEDEEDTNETENEVENEEATEEEASGSEEDSADSLSEEVPTEPAPVDLAEPVIDLPDLPPADPAPVETEDLEQRIKDHTAEGEELRRLVEDKAEETANMIDEFLGKNDGTFARRKLADSDVKDDNLPDQDEKVYAHEFALEEAKKGKEVMTPHGPGKIEEISEDDRYCMVRLTESGELRPYTVNRLRKTEAVNEFKTGDIVSLKVQFGRKGTIQYLDPAGNYIVYWQDGEKQAVHPGLLDKVAAVDEAEEPPVAGPVVVLIDGKEDPEALSVMFEELFGEDFSQGEMADAQQGLAGESLEGVEPDEDELPEDEGPSTAIARYSR